ncbi:MAG TPA: histidine kinase [Kineosporiaceae bacterium]|nr:histidine kinase [Kineosporiaceae bacterium]
MTSLAARLRIPPRDGALALALTAAALLQLAFVPIAAPALGALYVLGSTLPLAWRRTRPVEAAAISSAFWLIPLQGYPVLGFVAVVLQFYALGAWGTPRLAVAVVTAWACVVGVIGTLLGPEPAVAVVGAVLSVVAPVAAGLAVAHQRRQTNELVRLASELEAEKAKVEQAAVGAERARIARELHDVVGHELTLIAIQAEAAAAALASAPERAAAPVEAIRTTAHRTLAEIRSTLDVLAPADTPADVSPGGLSKLARRAEQAGIPNTLVVTGEPWPAHASVWLAVNRVVRECLTNAGRHAPGRPVALCVEWRTDGVTITSSNPTVPGDGSRPTPGRGLAGMRHRTELLGGAFEAGVRDGSFDVRVRIPSTPAGAVP